MASKTTNYSAIKKQSDMGSAPACLLLSRSTNELLDIFHRTGPVNPR
jgi:hypothetical protein